MLNSLPPALGVAASAALLAAGCGGAGRRPPSLTSAAERICRHADERLARLPLPAAQHRNPSIPYTRLRAASTILAGEEQGLAHLEIDATARRRLKPLVARVHTLANWSGTMSQAVFQPTPELIKSGYRSLNRTEVADLRAEEAAARAAALPACVPSSRARRVMVVHAFY